MSLVFTENELKEIASTFLKENYEISLKIPVIRNNRLRSTLGRYVINNKGEPLRIELSGTLLTYGAKETIIGVLNHECIHYAFHKQGKPMHDGNPLFERALAKHKAPSTKTLKVGKFYTYYCERCKKPGESRLKRLVTHCDDYRTKCCRAKIILTGEKIYNGINS